MLNKLSWPLSPLGAILVIRPTVAVLLLQVTTRFKVGSSNPSVVALCGVSILTPLASPQFTAEALQYSPPFQEE